MADIVVGTAFTAVDRISSAFKKMAGNAGMFDDKAGKSFKNASRSASRFGDIVKGVLTAGLVQKGVGALQQGISAAATEFISFDDSVTAASAKFVDLNLATEAGKKRFDELKAAARKVGAETEFSATQAAKGLDFLAMAGFNSTQAMAALPGVVDLATAGNLDLATATDIASDSLGAFGLMTQNSAQLQKNLTRINDVFAKTATTANTTVEALFESAKKGAPDFTNAGQSIETFAALAGTMANSGIKAEEAGTQLRNTIVNLSARTPAAEEALYRLGVSVETADGKFRDVVDIFADLQNGLNGVTSDTEKTALITDIFGKRSSGLKVLLSSNIGELRKYREGLINSSGAAKKMADIMRGSLGNQLKSLQSALFELAFKFFGEFKGSGENAILAVTEAVRNFDVKPIIDGIKTAVTVFKTVVEFIKPFMPLIEGVIIAWGTYAAITKVVAIAQGVLNAIMTANPIGLIITGIGLLIGAGIMLYQNWETVSSVFTSVWGSITTTARESVDYILGIFANLVKTIISTIKQVSGFIGIDITSSASGVDKIAEMQKRNAELIAEGTRTAPNQAEINARQSVNVSGQIDVNAPAGSVAKPSKTATPGINFNMLGVQ